MSDVLNSFMDGRKNSKGFMIAEVADNMDTTDSYENGKMIGRVKLKIPGISDEIDTKDLPWAYQMSSVGSGTHDGVGSFKIPAVGTKVICMKLDNHYGWVVLGELNTTKHKLDDYHEDYPETWGMRDKSGNKSVINMFKQFAHFTHSSGSNILIESDGDVTATVTKDIEGYISGYGSWNYGKYLKEDIGDFYQKTVAGYGYEKYGTDYIHAAGGFGWFEFGGKYNLSADGIGTMKFGTSLSVSTTTIYLDANVVVNGWVHSSDDMVAGIISLQHHRHTVPWIKGGISSRITTQPNGTSMY